MHKAYTVSDVIKIVKVPAFELTPSNFSDIAFVTLILNLPNTVRNIEIADNNGQIFITSYNFT